MKLVVTCEHRVGDLRIPRQTVTLRAVRRELLLVGLALAVAACGDGHSARRSSGGPAGASSRRSAGSIASTAPRATGGLLNASRVALRTTEPVSERDDAVAAQSAFAGPPVSREPAERQPRRGPVGLVFAQTISGVLWVTELAGENNLNYCADPVTGRLRARLALLPGDSVFLTADADQIYYSYVPINARAADLIRAPISRRCMT